MFSQKSVFVAGAGPVGLTAAVELTRRGFPVRIVDPDTAPSPQSRALAVNSRTLELMEPSGVTDALLAAGLNAKALVLRRGQHILARIDLTTIPHRYNFLLVLAQSRTEEILAAHLADHGVKVERNVGLDSFAAGRRIDLNLSDKSCTSTDILVGADGSHSPVRKALGIAFDGETHPESFGLADVTLRDWPFPFDTVVLTILDTHLAPFIPMGEGFGRFISTRPDCLNSLPPDAKVGEVVWDTDFKISYRQAATYQDHNVFLAGDAAHIHSPVGGRGMNLGMEDACWLAYLLQQGREAEYTALRHPVGADVLTFTHRFTRFARASSLLQTAGLGVLAPIVARVPPLRNMVFSALTALNTPPAPWLQDSPLTPS